MKRFYRDYHENEGFLRFEVVVEESDLLVIIEACDEPTVIKEYAYEVVETIRAQIKTHIKHYPDFLVSLGPLEGIPVEDDVLLRMYSASVKADVGPMAAVAGITSEILGRALMGKYGLIDMIIENGGDLFINSSVDRQIAIYAGDSPLSDKVSLNIKGDDTPLGICTSAGTVGHSLSFGNADAAVVISKDTALADAVATSVGNRVKSDADIKSALDYAMGIEGVLGVLVVVGDKLGAKGQIELI